MYNTIDFETNEIFADGDPVEAFVAYIQTGLRSGLHPSYLTEDERAAMESVHGKDWEKKWLIDE